MAFENPCNKCVHAQTDICKNWQTCNRYHLWLNYCWKCARIAAKRTPRAKKDPSKWVYHHPDAVRKYINEGVCAKCPLNGNCDEPCGDYWDWWDARMEYFRKVLDADG